MVNEPCDEYLVIDRDGIAIMAFVLGLPMLPVSLKHVKAYTTQYQAIL